MNQNKLRGHAPLLSEKRVARIIHFPLFLINIYIGLTIVIYFMSPMFPEARNGFWTIVYGCAAMSCFSIGFMSAARSALPPLGKAQLPQRMLNLIILTACVVNIIYYLPLLQTAFSFYGFSNIADIGENIGENYHKKNALLEQIGEDSLGIFYTLLNIISITQVVPYALALFLREKLNRIVLLVLLVSALLTIAFFIAIGTMSGVFNLLVLLASGWLCRTFLFSLETSVTLRRASRLAGIITLTIGMLGLLFFCFMVFALASRMESNLVFGVTIFYEQDSIVYKLLGERFGNAFCVALFYLYGGWYGLGNSLEMDFEWTQLHSFSRVLDSYLIRFFGESGGALSYPVRQEIITGYPAYAYWHSIFPWFASDFTFVGTLLITSIFGAVYGWTWVKSIREGCLVSTSLFCMLSIGALFINANSQILDSKPLTLALAGLLVLMPFRRIISGIK